MRTYQISDPLLTMTLAPRTDADKDKMDVALAYLAADDPLSWVSTKPSFGQITIGGPNELYFDILIDRLRREFKVAVDVNAPQVAYRETISQEVEHSYTHNKQSGGSVQFAEVRLVISPTLPDEAYSFVSKTVGGSVPAELLPGVEKGIISIMDSGSRFGFPLIGFKVALIDGKCHETDSSVLAFEIAARMCMREGLLKAGPKMLEPIVTVEVSVAADFAGARSDLAPGHDQ
jgi:elongation factor G